jgi:hypothetical protein
MVLAWVSGVADAHALSRAAGRPFGHVAPPPRVSRIASRPFAGHFRGTPNSLAFPFFRGPCSVISSLGSWGLRPESDVEHPANRPHQASGMSYGGKVGGRF